MAACCLEPLSNCVSVFIHFYTIWVTDGQFYTEWTAQHFAKNTCSIAETLCVTPVLGNGFSSALCTAGVTVF